MTPFRWPRRALLLATAVLLAGCGFHLRQSAELPAAMQQLHLSVSGSAALANHLERELLQAGVTLHDEPAAGVAQLQVVANFASRALTISSFSKVREFTVILSARVAATNAEGEVLLTPQPIRMQREFTYDRRQALGTATREQQIRESLVKDMARAILRRLQALDTGATPAAG